MTKRIKIINVLLLSLLALSVICSSMYWFCKTDYPMKSPIARAILSNPITHKIWFAFIMPLPSLICSMFAFGTLAYAFDRATDHNTERKSKIFYWGFFIFALAVLILHIKTFYSTFFVE